MKRLHFSYEMQIDYSVEVARCNFTIKCFPKDNMRQNIINTNILLVPENHYSIGFDGLRNIQIYGVNEKPHTSFIFKIEGNAITGLADYEEEMEDDISMIFKHPYGLNVAGRGIGNYYKKIMPKKSLASYEKALEIMHSLHNDFKYELYSTNVDTTGEEAFLQGKGVCQDYAHIFIALLHLEGIPARYVTGLIIGEGASHAWVEALCDGRWYGFDPTNDTVVKDEHIKIGIGRDAKDCMINRGIMHGGGPQTQTVRVSVFEHK